MQVRARFGSWHRIGIAAVVIAALWACSGEEQRPAAGAVPPAGSAAATAPTGTAVAAPAAAPGSADADAPEAAVEAGQAARLAEARSYFERARRDAEERHLAAMQHCRDQVPAEFDACVATADESLEAELRAARVEFDARMMQGN
jgi:hypothetical protein